MQIFSLLANAARIQESLHQGPQGGTGTHAPAVSPDATPPGPRPVSHTRSHSLSTAGLDSVYSRPACAMQGIAPDLDYGEQFAGNEQKHRSQLSGEYAVPIERSSSADIATLNQMLRATSLSGVRNRDQTATAGIAVDASGCPVLPSSVAAVQIPGVSMLTQGGWSLPGEGQFPIGASAPLSQLGSLSPLYAGAAHNMMCNGLEILGIENWQQMERLVNEVNISELLRGQDGCPLDLESLQELEKSYLAPGCLSEWQNLLQGCGFTNFGDCGVLGNLPVSLPQAESTFQVANASGSATASCTSEDCTLPRSSSQEEQLPTCQH